MSTNNTLNLGLSFTGTGFLTAPADGSNPRETINLGTGSWPQLYADFATGVLSTPFASGAGQCNQWWSSLRTVAPTTADNLDMASGLTNNLGQAIVFTAVKFILISLAAINVDGVGKLRVGPQGITHGWQGPFGGVAAADYTTIDDWLIVCNNIYAGYPVTSGSADTLGIYNPSAESVTYAILIAGVQ